MKSELLKALQDADGFLSGQELSERFGVSRTAVWKVIAQLKAEGYEIESVTRRGYRLTGAPEDSYTEHGLLSARDTAWIGKNLIFFSETDSTNTQVKRLAEEGMPHGTLVIADAQTGGRGRRGRSFTSEKNVGIYMTALLRPEIQPANASRLTLLSALAVRRGIFEATGLETTIKWPNDIIASGKKVCGILTEMGTEEDRVSYVAIGIGINVSNSVFPEELEKLATSIFLETGEKPGRTAIVWAVWSAFEELYEKFLPTQDLSRVMDEYNSLLINRGREVEILSEESPCRGVARGINENGELLVETEDGIRKVRYGEVSVRGVYGYL